MHRRRSVTATVVCCTASRMAAYLKHGCAVGIAVCCVAAAVSAVQAGDSPAAASQPQEAAKPRADRLSVEALLPGDAAVYVRFDGLDPTAAAFAKTALSQLLATDLKPLADYTYQSLVDSMGPGFLSEQLLAGSRPETLLAFQETSVAYPRLMARLLSKGAAATLEVINPLKPRLQLTVVFPHVKEGTDRTAIVDSFRLLAMVNDVPVEAADYEGRQVWQFELEGARFAVWQQGPHMVATIGTEPLEHAFAVFDGKRPSLEKSELLALAQTPVAYPTCARGFVNVQGVAAMLSEAFPPTQLVVAALGFQNLKSLAFQFGFEGEYLRATSWMEVPGERTGLMRLLTSSQELKLDDLPALPPNATMVYATCLQWTELYDDLLAASKSIVSLAVPFGTPDVDDAVDGVNKQLGFNLRDDLIRALGDKLVVFDAPDQGPFMLGTTLAVEVRDEARLRETLGKVIRALDTALEARIRVETTEYRGTEVSLLRPADGSGDFALPTFAIHRGWLVVSVWPQPVRGFIYRNGDNPARRWEPPQSLQLALREIKGKEGARLVGVSAMDPRPAIEQVMASLPMYLTLLQQFGGAGRSVDLSILPPAQAITDVALPSASITFDDGHTVQTEWCSTVPFPAYFTGINVQLLFFASFAIGF